MSIPIIIAFRECFEMLLIIVPLLIYLNKIERFDLSKYIYMGCGTGALISVITGVLLIGQVGKLDGYLQQLFLGLTMILISVLILYSIVWVSNHNKEQTLNITDKYNIKLTGISLFILSLITIFRESLEIIMFLIPLANKSMILIIMGICIGVIASLILAFIIFKTSIKLNVYIIFSALTLILIFMGGSLFGEGLSIIFPKYGSEIESMGKLIYIVPLIYIFLKKELRKYLKK